MIYYYISSYFIFYYFQATIHYLEITALGKTEEVEDAERGNNSITKENTDENEETEDSTGTGAKD